MPDLFGYDPPPRRSVAPRIDSERDQLRRELRLLTDHCPGNIVNDSYNRTQDWKHAKKEASKALRARASMEDLTAAIKTMRAFER